jgi:enterochelin esterase-like enzyme
MFLKILTATLMLPALCIFAEEVKWQVPTGFDQASSSIPKGTVSAVINYPTRNYQNRACRVYTPPGYSATRAEKYPVMYLHHGIGGNQDAWTSMNGQAEGNADKVMDFLYAQANLNVTPMIVVMPMGNMTGTSGDAWQNFEDVLINDLAPYIEKNYNASSSATMRAIAGLSMGGGQTLNFGYKNPTVFNWMGAFSPAPNTIAAATTIKDMAAVKANVRMAYFGAGTGESGYLNTARTYHNYLNQNGVTPLYLNIVDNLGHERDNWNRQLHQFAQRIFKGTTGIAQMEPVKMVSVSDRQAILIRNGYSLTPWTINVVRTGTGLSTPQIFSLDGRVCVSLRSAKAVSQTIGSKK